MSKKLKKVAGTEFSFSRALERLLGKTDVQVEEEIKNSIREEEEVEFYVAERRDSIRRGARRAKKRFRP